MNARLEDRFEADERWADVREVRHELEAAGAPKDLVNHLVCRVREAVLMDAIATGGEAFEHIARKVLGRY